MVVAGAVESKLLVDNAGADNFVEHDLDAGPGDELSEQSLRT